MGRYKVDPVTGELTLMNPSMSDIPIYQGVSGSTASVSGLVPQAQAGDEEKALLGNGTWGTVAGGGQTISYADWLQLTPEEQAHGEYYIPDYSGSILPTGGFDNVPTAGSQNPVTSNGIYEVTKPFIGAQGSIAGIGGTVPAPSAGDQDKVLKGDGTWGEAAADDNFVGSLEEWNSLTPQQREKYKTVDTNDDFNGIPIDTELDTESTNPIQNQAVANPIEAIVNTYGSKNLLPNNATSQVINGVTFTVNSDGSITANGTATSQAVIYVTQSLSLPQSTYVLSGCPSGGRANTYYMVAKNGNAWLSPSDMGDGAILVNTPITAVAISIGASYTANNVVFKPMIRDVRITDPTYVPYAMTNRELTENVIKTIETSVMLSQVTWATVSNESSPMYYVTDLYSLPNARKIISAEITNFARLKTTDFIQPFIYNKAFGLMGNTNFSGRSYAMVEIQIAYI